MNHLTRLFAIALAAGSITGLVTGILQELVVNPLIFAAEAYEVRAVVLGEIPPDVAPFSSGWARNSTNILTSMVFGLGGGLVLAGAMSLTGKSGWRVGLIAGIAAFAIFALAPSLGLPPRPPAYPEADLFARQTWWLTTSACTAIGLGLIFLPRRTWAILAGIGLLAAPHIWGAPLVDQNTSLLPADLVWQFTFRSLIITGFFWISLGSLTGYLYGSRLSPKS